MSLSVSAVVVNYNSGDHLSRCLATLEAASDGLLIETVVVDNASVDGSLERATATHPGALVIRNTRNLGPGVARNRGASVANADLLLFVDPDVALSAGSVAAMTKALAVKPGVVAPPLYSHAHGRVEYGNSIDLVGHPIPLGASARPLFVSASAMMTPRDWFNRLRGFDHRVFWGEEIDYCWRVLLAGGEVTVLPDLPAEHACGAATPGGYARSGRVETTAFRLVNRERAALLTLLKCAPVHRLLWTVPMFAGYTCAMSVAALAMRRPDISSGLLQGMLWNAVGFRETLRLRRQTPRSVASERRAAERMHANLFALRMILDHGLPRFVDISHVKQTAAAFERLATREPV